MEQLLSTVLPKKQIEQKKHSTLYRNDPDPDNPDVSHSGRIIGESFFKWA